MLGRKSGCGKIESECRVISITNGIKMNGMKMRINEIFYCEYIQSSTDVTGKKYREKRGVNVRNGNTASNLKELIYIPDSTPSLSYHTRDPIITPSPPPVLGQNLRLRLPSVKSPSFITSKSCLMNKNLSVTTKYQDTKKKIPQFSLEYTALPLIWDSQKVQK